LCEMDAWEGYTIRIDTYEWEFFLSNRERTWLGLSSWSRNDGKLSLLDHEVILPIGFPGFLVPRCEFYINVPDQVCDGHSKLYSGCIMSCVLQ